VTEITTSIHIHCARGRLCQPPVVINNAGGRHKPTASTKTSMLAVVGPAPLHTKTSMPLGQIVSGLVGVTREGACMAQVGRGSRGGGVGRLKTGGGRGVEPRRQRSACGARE
jgi:hypothetical protein